MSKPATLADMLMRELYRPDSLLPAMAARSAPEIRDAITTANRFVLDGEMSSFLADLASVPFHGNRQRHPEILDSLRHSARLPHRITWIELDGLRFNKRLVELGYSKTISGQDLTTEDIIPVWGFLLEEHPKLPTAIKVSEFALMDKGEVFPITPGFHWAYSTTDDPPPWHIDLSGGSIGAGLIGYYTPCAGIVYTRPLQDEDKVQVKAGGTVFTTHRLAIETTGVLRYMFAFLATLGDVPTITSQIAAKGGFVARGRYRKYLDHTVIRLSIPHRTSREKLARKLIVAARRKGHMVMGHWRVLSHLAERDLCQPGTHLWAVVDDQHGKCGICGVKRTRIDEYHRGDDSLGFVVHSYHITHPKDAPAP